MLYLSNMSMSWEERIWFFAGVAVSVLLVIVISLVAGKKLRNYDERERAARGRAFETAFFVLLGWNICYMSLRLLLQRPFMEDGLGAMLGALLSTAVFGAITVWRDANSRGKGKEGSSYLVLLAVIVISDGVVGVQNLLRGELLRDGVLTFSVAPLAVAACFLTILAVSLCKRLAQRKEREEE